MLPNTTLIMPSNGIQAKKPAETSAKTIWYLLVDHQRQLRFGELTDLDVQANVTVAALKRMIKEENPTDLGPFEPNKLEVWKYKHADISSSPKSETLQEIVGGIEFLEGSKNPKRLLPVQKVTNIDLPENGILLVRVPPPQTTDTATAKRRGAGSINTFHWKRCILLSTVGYRPLIPLFSSPHECPSSATGPLAIDCGGQRRDISIRTREAPNLQWTPF